MYAMGITVTDVGTSRLGEYILELCERNRLSMREASIEAGLGTETIGVIIRRGNTTTPRPDTLRLIADALGGNYEYMMRLAGHLDPLPPQDDPELRAMLDEIARLWQIIKKHQPDRIPTLARMAQMQAELVLAAARAASGLGREETRERERDQAEEEKEGRFVTDA